MLAVEIGSGGSCRISRQMGQDAISEDELNSMQEHFVVTCPYCGQVVEIYIEADVNGTLIQDCEVCCNPWRARIENVDGARDITVVRADGSE